MAKEFDGHALKMWRKKQSLTQADVGNLFSVTPLTVGRWETGASPVPPHVVKHCEENKTDSTAIQMAEQTRTTEYVRQALELAEGYIYYLQTIPERMGLDTPAAFAVSYWGEGALVMGQRRWGANTTTPCPEAVAAMNRRLFEYWETGDFYLMIEQLDDCPPRHKAIAAKVREGRASGTPFIPIPLRFANQTAEQKILTAAALAAAQRRGTPQAPLAHAPTPAGRPAFPDAFADGPAPMASPAADPFASITPPDKFVSAEA